MANRNKLTGLGACVDDPVDEISLDTLVCQGLELSVLPQSQIFLRRHLGFPHEVLDNRSLNHALDGLS